MVLSNLIEAHVSESHGSVARHKNTEKLWVPAQFITDGVTTGTWALETATLINTFATDDVGGAGETILIPWVGEFSDAAIENGAAAVDRGVKVIGLELMYQVAVSALAAMDLDIHHLTFDLEGTPTNAETVTTLTFDTDGDDGTEVDLHRVVASVAKPARTFVTTTNIPQGVFTISDGTASDVNISGAFWHIERVVE